MSAWSPPPGSHSSAARSGASISTPRRSPGSAEAWGLGARAPVEPARRWSFVVYPFLIGGALVGLLGILQFLGIDLVLDRETRTAAPLQASYVVNRLRECGILAGTDGPHHNVIKLRPPLVFSKADADLFLKTLDAILQEDAAQPARSA